jgi:hypothetical protein
VIVLPSLKGDPSKSLVLPHPIVIGSLPVFGSGYAFK